LFGGMIVAPIGQRPLARHSHARFSSGNRIPIFSIMKKRFKVGHHVSWNSEAGRVSGRIVKVHSEDVNFKGYVHHASADDPQYEIKSDRTDHIALHKGSALRRLPRRQARGPQRKQAR
jgi:hypothetical protein